MNKTVRAGKVMIGFQQPLAIISGPCVIENEAITLQIASFLKNLAEKLEFPLIFKASYDKANRTSIHSFRGPGIDEGLRILEKVKQEFEVPILSDVHRFEEIEAASQVLDVIQIPAFLCRQTDFIVEVARTEKTVNIKKGQFLAPWDITQVIEKVVSAGCNQVIVTERGSTFGYNNLVVDFRGIPIMKQTGWPVVFDATHSVQIPGGKGSCSGGNREFAPVLAKAAVAAGVDAIFMEVHPDPDNALCDGPNSLKLDVLEKLFNDLKKIQKAIAKEIF